MKDEILHKKSRKDFDERVYQIVMQIPYGKVTTYGHMLHHLVHENHQEWLVMLLIM